MHHKLQQVTGPMLAWICVICAICIYLQLSVFICATSVPLSVPSIFPFFFKQLWLQSTTLSQASLNSHTHFWTGQHGKRMLRSSSNLRTSSAWLMGVPLHPLTPPNYWNGRSETSMCILLCIYLLVSSNENHIIAQASLGSNACPLLETEFKKDVATFTATSTMLPMTHPNQSLNSLILFNPSHTDLLL